MPITTWSDTSSCKTPRRIFPKGIILGAVKRVDKLEGGLFQKVEVTPSVNFDKLEEVLVLVFDKEERK